LLRLLQNLCNRRQPPPDCAARPNFNEIVESLFVLVYVAFGTMWLKTRIRAVIGAILSLAALFLWPDLSGSGHHNFI